MRHHGIMAPHHAITSACYGSHNASKAQSCTKESDLQDPDFPFLPIDRAFVTSFVVIVFQYIVKST